MRTYKLYQVGMLSNVAYFTYVSEVQAADESTAEDLLLANVPTDGIEYMITVVK